MIKFTIKNRQSSAVLAEIQVADEAAGLQYIASHPGLFGKEDRWVSQHELDQLGIDSSGSVASRTVVDQAAVGNPGDLDYQAEQSHQEFHFLSDYIYESADVSAAVSHEQGLAARQEKKAFCDGILNEIGLLNEQSHASTATMDAFFANENAKQVMLALLTGSPESASRMMKAHGTDFYPQATVDAFTAKIDAKYPPQA